MAGGKLPPRQKMISMMYLVLTCLLAMNVAKSVLDAFIVFNDSLQRTNEKFIGQNERTYLAFDRAEEKEGAKVKPFNDKAKQAKAICADLVKYIDRVKAKVLVMTELKDESLMAAGDTMQLKYINSKDNYDEPTRLLIGGEVTNPITGDLTASDLKAKMDKARADLLALFNDIPVLKAAQKELDAKLALRTDIKAIEGDVEVGWDIINFYHLPLVAVVANLTAMQAEVRNAEADVINTLFSQIGATDYKFDQLNARVLAKSGVVQQGAQFEADVLLLASSSTSKPSIYIGKYDSTQKKMIGSYDSLIIEGGVGKLTRSASTPGEQKISGAIKIEKPGEGWKFYEFESSYIVMPPSLVVSPDMMNVVYAGIPNPITVSVPGVASELLQVSSTVGSLTPTSAKEGKYNIVVPPNAGKEVLVNVSIKDEKGTRSAGPGFKFRVKQLPTPSVRIGAIDLAKGTVVPSDLKGIPFISAKPENFDLDVKYTVQSFTVVVMKGNKPLEAKSDGAKMSEEQQRLLNDVKKGNKVYFEDVKVLDPSGKIVTANIVSLKVI